jgi:U3 small nucleolar RNA-associated protein 7
MIALDPESLGGFAPQSLPAPEGTTDQSGTAMSFARQPRLHRLHVQGKADETEDASEDEAAGKESLVGSGNPSKRDRVGRDKRKMRGKDKSLKRFVIIHHIFSLVKRNALKFWFSH